MYEDLVKRMREESEIERWLQPHSANETPKLLDDAANAIEELSNPKWIPVTEALPELDKRVFVIGLFGFCGIYSLIQVHDTTCWEDEYGYYQDFEDVTHWMPLPEPPKEEA